MTGYDPQILAALVDGTLGKTSLNPPSGGWPTGANFRVNLVQDDSNLSAILAQSPEFTINATASTTGSFVTSFSLLSDSILFLPCKQCSD